MRIRCRRIVVFAVMILLLSTYLFAGSQYNIQWGPGGRPLRYTTISYENIRGVRGLEVWYQRHYQRQGVYSRRFRGTTYVLISGGQRPTGGYRIALSDIRRTQRDTVFITARVVPPPRNMIVTQAITYPNLLIRIDDPYIRRVEGRVGEFREESEADET